MTKQFTGKLAWDTREPCASCPYRMDATLEKWHASEFQAVLEADADPLRGSIFACHGTLKVERKSVCGGWLLDQKRRGLPSIQLRLALMSASENKDDARRCLDEITDGGHPLYPSIAAMCEANAVEAE